ncbi:hypothetical protein [Sandarakinorhabdus sp. DWP1-3-1]|uniref:hypothetical protein n=1 Tax=Sandarakinorhabdus sp. DWP1-3-1 TaxID=2804627 RepID=UPI003CF7DE4B
MTDLITLTRRQIAPDRIDSLATLVGTDNATAAQLFAGAVSLLIGSRGLSAAGVEGLLAAPRAAPDLELEPALALLAGLSGSKVELMARALAGASGSTISAATRTLAIATPLLGNAIVAALAQADQRPTRGAALQLLAANQSAAVDAMRPALRRGIGRLPGLAGLYTIAQADGRRDYSWAALAGLALLLIVILLLRG